MDDFTWLTLPETGGTNRFPSAAVELWKARGWVECDPPAWSDPTRAHIADVDEPAPPPAADPPTAVPASIPKTRRPAGDPTGPEEQA